MERSLTGAGEGVFDRNMRVTTEAPVTVYWRPWCPYCARLRRDLRALGLPTHEVDIWKDPSAAAVVRGYADGNETVPTVVVGGRGYVNPSATTVLEQAREAVPGLALDAELARSAGRIRLLRRVQWVLVAGLIATGFALSVRGHSVLGWALDGAAAAVYAASLFTIARMAKPSAA